jgi:hypothetical protein
LRIFLALLKNKIIFRSVPKCQYLSLIPGFFPKKFCRYPRLTRWTILEKEVLDEIIFRTTKSGHRLILELMARRGMRIGEVLKLPPGDDARYSRVSPLPRQQKATAFGRG